MKKLSVVIPNRDCPFLKQTIQTCLDASVGDIEVIINVDGSPPRPEDVIKDKRVSYLIPGHTIGMRAGINACVKVATGDYVFKIDDHVKVCDGYDRILQEMEDNWVVVPRRYSLDAEHWVIENNPKGPRDYHYLCFPAHDKDHDMGMHGVEWPQRTRERTDHKYDIDDTMSMQGSGWFMTRRFFTDVMGGMNPSGYGQFSQEAQEIGNKAILSGGRLVVNKKAWYAHLHKGHRYGRMYHLDQSDAINGSNWSAFYWMNDMWPGATVSLEAFIRAFWPVPTWPQEWMEDWQKCLKEWNSERLKRGFVYHPQEGSRW